LKKTDPLQRERSYTDVSMKTRFNGIFEGVTAYHWMVVIIASCGWLFDCMDQRIFVLARESAITDLLGGTAAGDTVKHYLGYATTSLILGWATGGIIFGMMSDRVGRVRTMVITLLIYSGFTGLSGIAVSWIDFTIYRFLMGMGVGGMFGAATTLVAESVPPSFRTLALGSLQAFSAVGTILGSAASYWIRPGTKDLLFGMPGWRLLFFVGIIPALLVIPMLGILREPEAWKKVRQDAAENPGRIGIGSPLDLFREKRWRRNTLVGLGLGFAGMAGLWGIAFFSPELISTALAGEPQQVIDQVRAKGTALQDIGAFFGMMTFTFLAAWLGRRLAFLLSFLGCMIITGYVFASLNSASDAYWMLPLMGFAQLASFAGYTIYFPEIFPSRLRGTGVGFCYNTVRYLAAPAPILLGYMAASAGIRQAAIIMCSVYLIGMFALIWAPETRNKSLPE